MSRFVGAELSPNCRSEADLRSFIRENAGTYWHQSCTTKMGRGPLSVVDAQLKVYGVDCLRVAGAGVMPRVTMANTMAPCVVIGERAVAMIKAEHAF